MREHDVSQVPVTEDGRVVGLVDEVSVLQALNRRLDPATAPVREAMGLPPPRLPPTTSVSEAYRVLLSWCSGILVEENWVLRGYVGRIDLVRFWAEG